MPIQRAAFKSIRKDKKRRARNLKIASELKSLEKKFRALIGAKKTVEAKVALKTLVSRLDKAASKGILHKNRASRKISRLTRTLVKSERGQ